MAANSTAEQIARDRALARLFSLASGERVMATEVYGTKAKALAESHHRTAELLNLLAKAAPGVWGDGERIDATASRTTYLEGF